jgi:serine/threonine protein kinase/Tfp pilus assembly protein PilF
MSDAFDSQKTAAYDAGPTPDLTALVRQQIERWDRGDCIPVEELLAQAPALAADPEAALDLIAHELALRAQRGDTPDPNDYRRRFPHLVAQLEAYLAAEQAMAQSPSPPATITHAGRYQLLGEIARGGMGEVLRARDTELDRELAVKVLLEKYRELPHMVRRFVTEARISARLQHPGVVSVHELGRLPDGRPFLAMKLVQGSTLAALLKERQPDSSGGAPGSWSDLPRFLGILGQVCQTVAYAHSRNVIHRDLKPANVMVGAFGEVQVMDWGLAKVLVPTTADAETENGGPRGETITASTAGARKGDTDSAVSTADPTGAGTVLGTLAYMPPEQARGEVDYLDERCDVFALGAILCQILVGQTPYAGVDPAEVHDKAMRGDLAELFARLDGCGAEETLIALAKRCLAPVKEDRPRHAGQVAEAIDRYQVQVQERLRQAELEREKAEVQAEEERRRREVEHARVEEERKRRLAELAQRVAEAGRYTAEREQFEEENRRKKAEKQKAATARRLRNFWILLPLFVLPVLLFCCYMPAMRFWVESMPKSTSDPQSAYQERKREAAVRHLNKGAALVQQKDYAGAITEFQQASTLDPNFAQAHVNWGVALYAQKDYAGAAHQYEQAINLDPTSAQAENGWGAALAGQHDYAGAIIHYQKAVDLNSNYAEAHFNWGVSLVKKQKYASAVFQFEKATTLNPNFALAHGALGEVFLLQGEFDDAIQSTRRAIRLLPPGDPLRNVYQDLLARCQKLRQKGQRR